MQDLERQKKFASSKVSPSPTKIPTSSPESQPSMAIRESLAGQVTVVVKIKLKTKKQTFESTSTLKDVMDGFSGEGAFSTVLVKYPPPRRVFNLTNIESLNISLGELAGETSTELVLEALDFSRSVHEHRSMVMLLTMITVINRRRF